MGWGAAIAAATNAATSIAGHFLNQAENDRARSSNQSFQREINQLNYEAQKEFAQNGIRWRVSDAQAAGLHPLAALGASPLGFSPSFSGGGFASSSDWSDVANGIGNFANQMGQNIDRAIEAKATEKERAEVAAYESEARKLDLENKQLQNDSLRQRMVDNALASMQALRTQAGQPPAMQEVIPTISAGRSLPGQGDAHPSSLVTIKPAEVVASHKQTSYAEAGKNPDVNYDHIGNGAYAIMRSQNAQNALEDDILGGLAWNMRNRLLPTIADFGNPPPKSYLPDKGKTGKYDWTFNPTLQAWVPYRVGSILSRINSRFNPGVHVQ